MSSVLDCKLGAHPSLRRPLEEIIRFLEGGKWGKIELVIKNGRIKTAHYTETKEILE